jgi:predicted RNA-binding Zn-ribbon protein involved in translation (DUF1610 family)
VTKMKKETKVDEKSVDLQTLLNESQIHDFMKSLIRKGVLELKPSLEKSGIRYLDAEAFLYKSDLVSVKNTLEELVSQGVLKDKIVDRTLLCPNCSSPEVHSKFACPRCNFNSVMLTQLIEHKTCGYIGARKDFLKNDLLICPRCGANISSDLESYRIIGDFYQCDNCGNRFDKPDVIHVCQNCGKTSTFQDIKYTKVFSYRISEDVLYKLANELPILESIRLFFEQNGFTVRLRSQLVGASGVQSLFDVVAEKGAIRIAIDTSLEGNKDDIVALLAKKMDVNPSKVLLLDLSCGEELLTLGRIYGIDVVSVGADQILSEETKKLLSGFVGGQK